MEGYMTLRQTDVLKVGDGTYNVAKGLLLEVKRNGASRSWVLTAKVAGKRYRRGLGSAHDLTIAQAKEAAEQLRVALRSGQTQTKAQHSAAANPDVRTFRSIYKEAIVAKAEVARWKNEKHAAQWYATIETYALPVIGAKDVADITRDDILQVLRPIWTTKTETATRLRNRLEIILSYCIRRGYRNKENPARWRDGLEFDLPSPNKIQTVKHHAAITCDTLRAIIPRLRRSISGKAILFGVLTATRVQEFCAARWEEIDFEARVWSIPPERRKDGKPYPHRVPLSQQAVELLQSLPQDEPCLFPGMHSAHLSLETPRAVLRKITGEALTMHGCRSTFRDWCAETGQDPILAEKSLMHATGSEVEQAYQRSDLLEQRRPLMQAWADMLCK